MKLLKIQGVLGADLSNPSCGRFSFLLVPADSSFLSWLRISHDWTIEP
jgi:hypothetical protein